MAAIDFAISADWRITKWGAGMRSTSGFSSSEVVGKKVMDIFTADVHDIVREKFQQASEGMGLQYFRIMFFTKMAEELDVFMYAHREEMPVDADIVVLGGIIPSTVSAPFCRKPLTIGVDQEGSVTLWDEAAEEVTGMNSKLVQGKRFVDYIMTEDFGAKYFMAEQIKRTMAGEHVGRFMIPIFTKWAELKIVELSASPGIDGGVVLTGYMPTASKIKLADEEGTADTLATIAPTSELSNIATSTSDLQGFHALSSPDLCAITPRKKRSNMRDLFRSCD